MHCDKLSKKTILRHLHMQGVDSEATHYVLEQSLCGYNKPKRSNRGRPADL